MRNTFVSILALAALALAGCTSHPASTPVEKALAVVSPTTHNPIAAYSDYETRSQLAEGLYLAGIAQLDVGDYFYGHDGKLPTSGAQARSVETPNYPKFDAPGKYVGSVSVGPAPGVVTVEWARGALAGKSIVLLPVRGEQLCWRVGPSTTVPAGTLASANIVGECRSDE